MKRLNNWLDKISVEAKGFWYFFDDAAFGYKAGKSVRIYNAQPLIYSWNEGMAKTVKKINIKTSALQGLNEGFNKLSDGLIQGGSYLFVGLHALSGLIGLGEVVRYAVRFISSPERCRS